MNTSPHSIYRVELALQNAEHVGSSGWLYGALVSTFPNAEVLLLRHYGRAQAVVDMRWRAPGQIDVGQRVQPLFEGLVAVPGSGLPSATVQSVVVAEVLGEKPIVDAVKNLVMAAALLGATVALSMRVAS